MKSTAEAISDKDIGPTPGPYFHEPIPADAYSDPDLGIRKDSLFWIVDSRVAGEVIAVVDKVAGGVEQAQANARLFAAAWSMREALQHAEAVMADADLDHEPTGDPARVAIEAVRAALKLAEGR